MTTLNNTYTADVTAFEVFHHEVGYDHSAVQDYRRVDEEPGEILEVRRVDEELMYINFERDEDDQIIGFSYAVYFEGEDIESGGSAETVFEEALVGLIDQITEWLAQSTVV